MATASKNIRTRFVISLTANLVRAAFGFLAGLFIARGLAPSGYGDFNFLIASFTSISQLIEVGSSNAFFTFISRRRRGKKFFGYYGLWLAVQFLITLFLAAALLPEWLRLKIWVGHGVPIVVLSLFASFSMNQIWAAAGQTGESLRETFYVQLMNVALSVVHLFAILFLLNFHSMDIRNLFILITVEYLVFGAVIYRRLIGRLADAAEDMDLTLPRFIEEFKEYCTPLLPYVVVNVAYNFFDPWLIQNFSGPKEQGYYSAAFRFTFISSIATAAMMQVFWKELAEAKERNDMKRINYLHVRAGRTLYFIAAAMSCFMVPFTRDLILWLLGPEYLPAETCMKVMLFFPAIQTLGQIHNVAYFALGYTKLYRDIGIVFIIVSLPVTYFIIAPPDAYYAGGLGLGATGLAMKIVGFNLLLVNAMGYFISKRHGLDFDWPFQIVGIVLLLLAGTASYGASGFLLAAAIGKVSAPTSLMFGLVIYMPFVLAILYLFPWLVSSDRTEMNALIKRAWEFAVSSGREAGA